jgi:hypothetical protein
VKREECKEKRVKKRKRESWKEGMMERRNDEKKE